MRNFEKRWEEIEKVVWEHMGDILEVESVEIESRLFGNGTVGIIFNLDTKECYTDEGIEKLKDNEIYVTFIEESAVLDNFAEEYEYDDISEYDLEKLSNEETDYLWSLINGDLLHPKRTLWFAEDLFYEGLYENNKITEEEYEKIQRKITSKYLEDFEKAIKLFENFSKQIG